MSKYVSGSIVKNGDLERIARLRVKTVVEETVDKPLALKYKDNNWEIKREYKRSLRIYKNKREDECFEDEVWLLFKKMGFKEMNKDRNFRVGYGANQKQIDVFAKDSNHIFIVECKASEKLARRDLSKDIREILQIKKHIIKSLRDYYKNDYRFTFLLLTKNIIVSQGDLELAKENVNKSFYLWTEREIQSYKNLADQFGEHTRFIMYSILFANKRLSAPETVKVPAILGGKGNNKYYYFVVQPEKLLNGITYIHRREERNPEEAMYTYQRMLNKNRLKRIKEFVQEGGYFANNIIVNFTNKPKFEKKTKIGDIVLGTLTFPKQYGSAWVIDGQHRLYGYLDSGKSENAYIPVLAFNNIAVKEQARLFVDINKEQKPVSAGLLWDLYSDIYADSTDPKQQELAAISAIAKKLNAEKDSPLHQLIRLPSQSKNLQKKAHLTLTTVCIAIKENRLIKKKDDLLFDENYKKSIDTAYGVISAYFETISKSFPTDWQKAEKGLLCSNIGIRIFVNILRQLLKFLELHGDKNTYLAKNKDRFNSKTIELLKPVIGKIKGMTPKQRDKIRGDSNKALIMENTQKLLWDLKEKGNFGIELWRKGGWTPEIPEDESDKEIKKLIEETEIELKSFIVQELKLLFGKRWWKKGIPSDTQKYIQKNIKRDISKAPWRKDELNSLPLEKRLRFASTSHIKDLIIKKNNWDHFKRYFAKDKEVVSTAFKFYEVIRNKFIHPQRVEDLSDIEKGLGYWNMKWLRRCIGLTK